MESQGETARPSEVYKVDIGETHTLWNVYDTKFKLENRYGIIDAVGSGAYGQSLLQKIMKQRKVSQIWLQLRRLNELLNILCFQKGLSENLKYSDF